jgi:hypothetical protein
MLEKLLEGLPKVFLIIHLRLRVKQKVVYLKRPRYHALWVQTSSLCYKKLLPVEGESYLRTTQYGSRAGLLKSIPTGATGSATLGLGERMIIAHKRQLWLSR